MFSKKYISFFQILGFVKFIGISGSVAAKIANPEDDIDLFIVVKNGSSWLYRGILKLGIKLFYHAFLRQFFEGWQ